MAAKVPADLMEDPALYIFTSLTAGSAHIVTATSRLETILRANRVPFKALDIAVDPRARQLWGRRAGKDSSGRLRKLPALFQEGFLVGVSQTDNPCPITQERSSRPLPHLSAARHWRTPISATKMLTKAPLWHG